MLSPLRRPSHLTQRLRHCCYATEAATSSRPHTRDHVPPPQNSRANRDRPYLRNQHLFVWCRDEGVTTMPEMLGIVRGMERELGRVKDFQFQRDPFDTTRFLRWFRVRLEDPQYWDNLPETGALLKVSIPVLPASASNRPGGIGIGDIQGLLDAQDKVAEDHVPPEEEERSSHGTQNRDAAEAEVKRIEIHIQRSTTKDPEPAVFLIGKERRMAIGQSFIRWGGFYQPAPVSAEGSEASTQQPETLARMSKLKERYATSAVEESRAENEEGVAESEEAQSEQSVSDGVIQAVSEEAPTEFAKDTATSSESINEMDQPLAASVAESTPPPPPSSPSPPKPSHQSSVLSKRAQRKERLLELARMNAQKPLPDALVKRELELPAPSEEELAAKERKEREKNPQAIRERLWRLMGGLLP